ncbi:MAG: TIR domain-containing protein [Candidatus Thiodiazotropha endolucinida]
MSILLKMITKPDRHERQHGPFISYAREDHPFVRELSDALIVLDCEPWVDWDISPAAVWMAEVESAIDAARAFLFVISPDSVASEICHREIEYAVAQNKRLIPVLYRDVDVGLVSKAVRDVNWIHAGDTRDLGSLAQSLLRVMDTDLEWVNAHSRLLVQAHDWENKDHDESMLLSGNALQRTEQWFSKSDALDPRPSSLQTAYLIASRKHQTVRSRRLLAGVTSALAITLVLAIYASLQTQRAETQRDIAQSRYLAAQAQERTSGPHPHLDQALLLAVLSRQISPTAEAQQSLYRALNAVPRVVRFEHTENTLVSIALSPDNRTIALGDFRGNVTLWELEAPGMRAEIQVSPAAINALSFHPAGEKLAAATADGVYVVTLVTREVDRLPIDSRHRNVLWHSDGTTLVFDTSDGMVIWDTTARQQLSAARVHPQRGVETFALSGDGETMASAAIWDTAIRIWDSRTHSVRLTLTGHRAFVRALAFSPDGTRLASGSKDGEVFIWSVADGRRLTTLSGYPSRVDVVKFSPDGRRLIAGGDNRFMLIWDLDSGDQREYLIGHTNGIMDAVLSQDTERLVSAAFEDKFIVWNLGVLPHRAFYTGNRADASTIAVSSDGMTVASGAEDGAVRFWNVVTGEAHTAQESYHEEIQSVVFSGDSDRLVWAADEDVVTVWDQRSGAVVHEMGERERVRSLALSPDGRTLASAVANRPAVAVWDLESGQRIGELSDPGVADNPNSMVFSPDGKLLLTAGWSGVHLWDATGGGLVAQLTDAQAIDVAFSPDGEWLAASLLSYCEVLTWTVNETAKEVPIGDGECDPGSTQIGFSPDGRALAITTGEFQEHIELWDHRSQARLATLEGQSTINDLAFLPDGRIVTGHTGGPLQVWAADVERWPERACKIANRNLTRAEWVELVSDDLVYRRVCPGLPLPDQKQRP